MLGLERPDPSLEGYGSTAQGPWKGGGLGGPIRREMEYEEVRKDPTRWSKTRAWSNAKEKRRSCEEGRTGWLTGKSGVADECAAIRMGCGDKSCKRCRKRRGKVIRETVDELMNAEPCIMLTLTLNHAVIDMFSSWDVIGACWRKCWERLCRRLPEDLTIAREGKPGAGERTHTRTTVRDEEHTWGSEPCPCHTGKAPAVNFKLEPVKDKAPGRERVPQAWVKEAHESGYAHMHVAVAIPWLHGDGRKDKKGIPYTGYEILKEEWWHACQDVTGIYELGGVIWISPPKSGDRTPGQYLAAYVTKVKNEIPDDIAAFLWGEGKRTFGSTGTKRYQWTEAALQVEWERASWVWEAWTDTPSRSAREGMVGELGRLVDSGCSVVAWSEFTVDSYPVETRTETICGEAIVFGREWNRDGKVIWVRKYGGILDRDGKLALGPVRDKGANPDDGIR